MEQIIEKMLCAFEAGKLTRRELVEQISSESSVQRGKQP